MAVSVVAVTKTCTHHSSTASGPLPPDDIVLDAGTIHLFEVNLKSFLRNADAPCWYESLNLLDSLVRIIAVKDAGLAARCDNLLLKFIWDEVTIVDVQRDLSLLLDNFPRLRKHFVGFLGAPLGSKIQQQAARLYLCALTGLPKHV